LKLFLSGFLALAGLAGTNIASAGTMQRIIVLGDSLSDNGNLFALDGGIYPPSPPYDQRGSNGPVAVEYMANLMHRTLVDFAVYGATTGTGNALNGTLPSPPGPFPGMAQQLTQALALAPFSPGDIFVVWGGANDLAAANFAPAAVLNAVSNLDAMVLLLEAAGAKHILVPGLPDAGLSPAATKLGPVISAQVTQVVLGFNQLLKSTLPSGAQYFDTFTLMHLILANAGAFGITNTTDACFDGTTVCADPNQYFFWDDVHPTTLTHLIVGSAFAAAIPEPGTLSLLAFGLILIPATSFRSKRAAA
jgi:cholinesterase